MRLRAKRDAVEAEIVKVLRKMGCTVAFISGKDVPDLLVGHRGKDHTIEVKSGTAKLRDGQAEWHKLWRGHKPIILRSVEDALAIFGSDAEDNTKGHTEAARQLREQSR